jgi:hypothetical protein
MTVLSMEAYGRCSAAVRRIHSCSRRSTRLGRSGAGSVSRIH